MKNLFFICLLGLYTAFAPAQERVMEMPLKRDYKPKNSGFTYMLPKNKFIVTVTVIRTDIVPGVYAEWADKLLALKNAAYNGSVLWTVKQVTIESMICGDETQTYFVELSKNQETSNFFSQWDNLLLPANNNVLPTVYQTKTNTTPAFFKNFANVLYEDIEEVYTETKIIDSVITHVPVSRTKTISKSTEAQARETADFITKIRKDRYELLAGSQEVAYTQETMGLMIAQLDALENNYVKLFTGYTIENERIYTFMVTPEENEKNFIFALDRENGVVDAPKTSSENYYLEYKKQNNASNLPKQDKNNQGYHIRKAVPVEVFLSTDKQILQNFGIYDILQWGTIITLPAHQDNFNIGKFVIIY